MDKIRRALGRTGPLAATPVPPPIDESITRVTYAGSDLPERFSRRAGQMKMKVASAAPDALAAGIIDFLKSAECRKIAIANSPLLEQLGIAAAVRDAGFDITPWDALTLDELYEDFDCAITDVNYAVAETGSLVVIPSAEQGRGLSLVPMVHVAIVQPQNIVADLVDLMDRLAADGQARSNVFLITGPSKTADIEMNVVTGVHGPNIVKVFVLQ